ncbi:MAG: UPF0280 family protein [Promethearchaeota archaeon]|nr:MAG: UPF0280 family protein [Candidatus Lokiarchaeota archaeon]
MKTYKHHFSEKDSDITIISESKMAISNAKKALFYHRAILEDYVAKKDTFKTSFSPVKVDSDEKVIKLMSEASFICDVGPMATVAGALADLMLESMESNKIKVKMVENGGELSIDSESPLNIALFAGANPLNINIGFRVKKEDCPIGIGTSSATVGHAISLGESDAVTLFAENATLADGGATKIGNIVKGKDIELSIKNALDLADDSEWIRGVFISREDKVGYTGKLPEIIKIEGDKHQLLKGKIESFFPDDYETFK